MLEQHQFDREKFKDVIVYLCGSDLAVGLGEIKLQKALYLADMLTYLSTRKPLTGVEYQKQQFGPIALHLHWALDELDRDGRVRVERSRKFGVPTLRFDVLDTASSNLTNGERELLDEVIRLVCSRSATSLSEINHEAAWALAEIGETLPYFTAYLLVPCAVTDEDVAWGDKEATRIRSAA